MCLYTLGKLPWVKADAIAFGLGGGAAFRLGQQLTEPARSGRLHQAAFGALNPPTPFR